MWPFFKAIRISLRYKWSIAGAIISSLAIAILWGASITTIYPFVKIVFRGETMETWVQQEIQRAEDGVVALETEIKELQSDPQNDLTVKNVQVESRKGSA